VHLNEAHATYVSGEIKHHRRGERREAGQPFCEIRRKFLASG
jgi:hypothetical protein